ncbi:MAG: hypothetical protein HY275_11585 [Gemmatimonadetes bacterium]|nr:hypothetical protein [Gemmatimonadota bacterium]
MNWRQVAAHLLVLAALEALREALGVKVWIGAFIGIPVTTFILMRLVRLQRRERLRQVAALAPAERARALEAMTDDERAAARIQLGIATVDDGRVAPGSERFGYPRTPWALREGTFWVSAIGAAVAFFAIVSGWHRTTFAWLVGLFLTGSVGMQQRLWNSDLVSFTLGPEGIEEVEPDGTRTFIRWSEVTGVKYRRWIASLDINAEPTGRRIRVRYNLEGFPRFAELLVAYLRREREG